MTLNYWMIVEYMKIFKPILISETFINDIDLQFYFIQNKFNDIRNVFIYDFDDVGCFLNSLDFIKHINVSFV